MALAVGLAVFAATVAWTFTRPKIYEATATVVVKLRLAIQVAESPDAVVCGIQCGETINTYVKVFESDVIARLVAKRIDASDRNGILRFFGEGLSEVTDEEPFIKAIKRSRHVRTDGTNRISISVRHPDPFGSARIATFFPAETHSWRTRIEHEETDRALEDLEARITKQRKRLGEMQKQTHPNNDTREGGSSYTASEEQYLRALSIEQETLNQLIARRDEIARQPPSTFSHFSFIPAEVPDSAVSPHIPLRLAAGLLAALALGPLASAIAARRSVPRDPTSET